MTVYLLVNHYVDASGLPLRLLRVQMARPGGNSTHDILTACRICQRFLLVSRCLIRQEKPNLLTNSN